MPTCVSCEAFSPMKSDYHQFTSKERLRPLWLDALSVDDAAKAAMDIHLRTASGKQYVCASHFSSDSYISPTSRDLKPDAVPISRRISPIYDDLTVANSPPPTPHHPLLFTPVARPASSRPIPSFRLAHESVPPCCRCCCKKESVKEMKKDSDWTPSRPTISNLPSSDYVIVSRDSLVQLLSRCNGCSSGLNNLIFSEDGHSLSCKCKCTACGEKFEWTNSSVLPTALASRKEKLKKINVDLVVGAAVTAVGTARLNYFLKAVGLNGVSKTSFHRLKSDYLLPAVTAIFTQAQEEIFARLKDRLDKGEELHIAGDGSFDSRGYSAQWCRYFLVDVKTGECLVHVLMNKKETGGSSGKLEVACLEKGLKVLADKIGGLTKIETLVTDRHAAVIKMMRDRFPSIHHYFDPWHYFRNLILKLLEISKPAYMGMVKFFTRRIINKAYGAVVAAQGDGDVASEMFRASLLCLSGIHDFSNDPSFTRFKKCTHSPSPPNYPVIAQGSRAYKRLENQVFTSKNIEDIRSVSWILTTSTCESLNSLAWRYAPKDNYFDRIGHELRTMMCILHWNELKRDELDGSRTVIGKKSYYNPTQKKAVFRNVKSKARNVWRDSVKDKAYEIRATLTCTPYAAVKQEDADKQRMKDHWNMINTPTVPHPEDSNLDASDDEDELPSPQNAIERMDQILAEAQFLMDEEDEYNRKKGEEEEEE